MFGSGGGGGGGNQGWSNRCGMQGTSGGGAIILSAREIIGSGMLNASGMDMAPAASAVSGGGGQEEK